MNLHVHLSSRQGLVTFHTGPELVLHRRFDSLLVQSLAQRVHHPRILQITVPLLIIDDLGMCTLPLSLLHVPLVTLRMRCGSNMHWK